MKTNTKKLTFLGISASVALILAFVESQIPPLLTAVPGIKLGLPNIIIILLLYKFSVKEAGIVSLIRLVAVALLFGNALTFIYSFSGAVLSLAIMFILKKTNLFSTVGVSIAGGVSHNLGQILAAIIILNTKQIGYYMIVLAISGTVSGILIGVASAILINRLDKIKID